jgi:beta-lactamase superfamily II metal-dependent hydrolase
MRLDIFDVEHGACSLLTCDNGSRLMIDCGHNASTTWRPHLQLLADGVDRLDMLAITNYDEDHVSALPELREHIKISQLWRNKSVSPETIRRLKSEDGMGRGIDSLVDMASVYCHPVQTQIDFPGVTRRAFHNSYPDFDDENNLSFVVSLELNGNGFLFPGDLECAGWLKLLESKEFQEVVRNTKVLIASHHGRVTGICEEVFDEYGCKPYYVVISDKGYMYDTQETVPYYRSKALGGPFRGETRHVLTTRKDGHIGFNFSQSGWGPA